MRFIILYILFFLKLFFYPVMPAFAQFDLVKSHQKISNLEGDFNDTLTAYDEFGYALTSLGDMNGDGVNDICVGAKKDDDGGFDNGAVWILFLTTDGSVKTHQKISSLEGNFTGILDDEDYFGRSITSLGDLNGDGITDICVGANKDDDGGTDKGAVWILFLDSNGTVKSYRKISDTEGNFNGQLDDVDLFGTSVINIGDINNDGITDIAVGANLDDDGGNNYGAIWILFLNADGTVKSYQKISSSEGDFSGMLIDGENFGVSLCGLGDLNNDGTNDLAVGSYDNISAYTEGAVWIFFLDESAKVKSFQKIAQGQGGFSGFLDTQDYFGISLANLGDINNDGNVDIAAGALFDDDGGTDKGACWLLYLNSDGKVKSYQKISSTEGGFTGTLDDEDYFGRSIAYMGDINADGSPDLCVGASNDDDMNSTSGALWTVFLDKDSISSSIKDQPVNDDVYFYPNPMEDYLFIHFNTGNPKYKICLLNVLGQEVIKPAESASDFIRIDVQSLVQGIYTLCFYSSSHSRIYQIAKK
jgi:hypothetical protein